MVKCAKCGHKWREFPPEDAPKKVDVPENDLPASAEPPKTEASASGMSIEEMTQVNQPAPRPRPQPEKKKRNWLGWLVFVALVGGILAGGYYQRNLVVQVMPGMASLYQKLKLDVKTTNLLGLEIRNLKSKQIIENGVTRLTVTGDIVNITAQDRPIPRIAVQLVDSNNTHVYSWTTRPEAESVAAWETVTFSSSMNQPPAEAKHVRANLVPPRKAPEEDASNPAGGGSEKATHKE